MPMHLSNSPDAARISAGERSWSDAMRRGLNHTCPACGHGALYRGYLKVTPECPSCGEALHHHRADDAPPYFTIFIAGHVLVGGMLALEQYSHPPVWVHLVIWLPLTIVLCAMLLPRVKGALIGLQWALRMHGFSAPRPDGQLSAESEVPQP